MSAEAGSWGPGPSPPPGWGGQRRARWRHPREESATPPGPQAPSRPHPPSSARRPHTPCTAWAAPGPYRPPSQPLGFRNLLGARLSLMTASRSRRGGERGLTRAGRGWKRASRSLSLVLRGGHAAGRTCRRGQPCPAPQGVGRAGAE